MPTPLPQRSTTAARLRAAVQSLDWQLPAFAPAARQTTPNPAKARQTTPSIAPAQNEPTLPHSPGAMPSLAANDAPSPANAPGEGRHASCANARQTTPNHANARHDDAPRKTNPPAKTAVRRRPPRPLTPNQLRAARLLLAGHSTTAIAAALAIDRHTLATWKRLPLFQQELRHLLAIPSHNS
jgi:hypothetical protein